MRQALTINKAIKIFKEPGRVGYEPLQETTVEAAQYNCDSELALMIALVSMEKLERINKIVFDMDGIQEDVLKYQMIVDILNENQEI